MPFIDVEGARLHYEVTGDGPTLLMTAGYGVPASLWGPLVPMLAEHFRVVTHDVRGFGETELSTEGTTIEQLADDLHAIVGEVGRPVLSLGHAFGAAIVQRHAVKHVADVRALVICSSGGLFPGDPQASANMFPLATKRDLDVEGYSKLFVEPYCGAGFGEQEDERAFLTGSFEATQTREQARTAVSALGTTPMRSGVSGSSQRCSSTAPSTASRARSVRSTLRGARTPSCAGCVARATSRRSSGPPAPPSSCASSRRRWTEPA